jgi:hypothetical protein
VDSIQSTVARGLSNSTEYVGILAGAQTDLLPAKWAKFNSIKSIRSAMSLITFRK